MLVLRAARRFVAIAAAVAGACGGAGCTRPDTATSSVPGAPDAGAAAEMAVTAVTAATAVTSPTSAATTGAATTAGLGTDALVREEATLTLDGVVETWRLVWARAPFPACRGAEGRSCTCAGFAPGERGDLDLVRERPNAPTQRLQLSPLFEEHETLLVAAGAAGAAGAPGAPGADGGARTLAFGDYDHDGRASELVFQVGAGPCGHTAWALLGVSSAHTDAGEDRTLHAFASAEDPRTPLVLDQRRDWETLRAKGSLDRVQVACGDHGADESTSLTVTASNGVLHAVAHRAACPQ